jgi:ribonuclease Y
VIWLVPPLVLLVGWLIGQRLGGSPLAAGEGQEDGTRSGRSQRRFRQKIERRWRHRIKRRERELATRTAQVENLERAIEMLTVNEQDQSEHAAAIAAADAAYAAHQSTHDSVRNTRRTVAELSADLSAALSARTEADCEQVVEDLEQRIVEAEGVRLAQWLRLARQELELGTEERARTLIEVCVSRYRESHSVDRLRSNIRCSDAVQVAHFAGFSKWFEEQGGMTLTASDREDFLVIGGADPWWKECIRRTLDTWADSDRSAPDQEQLEARVESVKAAMINQSRKCFDGTIAELSVGAITGESRRLLDRLRYRHSYRQNQWRHAAEVGYLSGMLAWELSLDPEVARRGGLMHDIGKAMTHEHEGGHALLGAGVARAEDEHPGVASCIGSHHGDEPPLGDEPFLVAAGDAISGARPGARVQGGEHHETLIKDLERIGRNPRGVDNAYTVRGGRELRVLLATEDRNGRRLRTSQEQMAEIAAKLKGDIEAGVTYPGTIDVTVIRRVVAEASAR